MGCSRTWFGFEFHPLWLSLLSIVPSQIRPFRMISCQVVQLLVQILIFLFPLPVLVQCSCGCCAQLPIWRPHLNSWFHPLVLDLWCKFCLCSTMPTMSASHSWIKSFILLSLLLPHILLDRLFQFSYRSLVMPSFFMPGITPCTRRKLLDTPLMSSFSCCCISPNWLILISLVPVLSTD